MNKAIDSLQYVPLPPAFLLLGKHSEDKVQMIRQQKNKQTKKTLINIKKNICRSKIHWEC